MSRMVSPGDLPMCVCTNFFGEAKLGGFGGIGGRFPGNTAGTRFTPAIPSKRWRLVSPIELYNGIRCLADVLSFAAIANRDFVGPGFRGELLNALCGAGNLGGGG